MLRPLSERPSEHGNSSLMIRSKDLVSSGSQVTSGYQLLHLPALAGVEFVKQQTNRIRSPHTRTDAELCHYALSQSLLRYHQCICTPVPRNPATSTPPQLVVDGDKEVEVFSLITHASLRVLLRRYHPHAQLQQWRELPLQSNA